MHTRLSQGIISLDHKTLNGETYFISENSNGLFKINKDGYADIVGVFPNYSITDNRLFLNMCVVDSKIFFIPGRADNIVVYNLNSRSFDSIPVDISKDNQGFMSSDPFGIKFLYYITTYDYIYIFGYSVPFCIRIEPNTYNVEYISNLTVGLSKDRNRKLFINGVATNNKKTYLLFGWDSQLVETDENLCNPIPHNFRDSFDSIDGMEMYCDKILLFGKYKEKTYLSVYNPEEKKSETRIEVEEEDAFYWRALTNGDEIFLMPAKGNKIVYIHATDWIVDYLQLDICNNGRIWSSVINDDNLEFQYDGDMGWYRYDIKNKSLSVKHHYISNNEYIEKWLNEKANASTQNMTYIEPLLSFHEYLSLLEKKRK